MQTPPQDTGFTKRPYSAPTTVPHCDHGALEDPIALPQRSHIALSRALCNRRAEALSLCMFKMNHSAYTARTQRCWRLFSAHHGDLQYF